MRDKRFIAAHRGGPLQQEQHRQLMHWACACAQHVLSFAPDQRLEDALLTAKEWEQGKTSVGEARKASLAAIVVAREAADPVAIAVARCVGHAVATAHMADHALRAADYAVKAAQLAGRHVDDERKWQAEQLPQAIKELVPGAGNAHSKENLKD